MPLRFVVVMPHHDVLQSALPEGRAHQGASPGESVRDAHVLLSDRTGSVFPQVQFPAGLVVRSPTALQGASGTVSMRSFGFGSN